MQTQTMPGGGLDSTPSGRMIDDERKWIDSPSIYGAPHTRGQILVSRWMGSADQPREDTSETDSNFHVIGIAVRAMNLAVYASQRLIHDGRMAPGSIQINKPAQSLRAIFRGCYDMLQLHVPNGLIAEILDDGRHAVGVADVFGDPAPFRDAIVEGLAHALIRAEHCDGPLGPTYADTIGLALTANLIARHAALSRRHQSQPSRP